MNIFKQKYIALVTAIISHRYMVALFGKYLKSIDLFTGGVKTVGVFILGAPNLSIVSNGVPIVKLLDTGCMPTHLMSKVSNGISFHIPSKSKDEVKETFLSELEFTPRNKPIELLVKLSKTYHKYTFITLYGVGGSKISLYVSNNKIWLSETRNNREQPDIVIGEILEYTKIRLFKRSNGLELFVDDTYVIQPCNYAINVVRIGVKSSCGDDTISGVSQATFSKVII
jgi:hypothetical protein